MRAGNVLISSAGRRVALLDLFRRALGELEVSGEVFAADASPLSAAFQLADRAFPVPRCNDPAFVPRMLELCREHRIRLVVPTIDPELPVYAAHRREFEAIGTLVAVSSPETVALGNDKEATHRWLVQNGLPTVRQLPAQTLADDPSALPFPVVLKPRGGSASIGVRMIRDAAALAREVLEEGLVAQTLAAGREHTVDVFVGRDGVPRSPVPRRRLEVRAGEVSKAVTVRHPELIALVRRLAAALPGAYGALNVQVFVGEGTLEVIEINPRFGGGFPLACEAGAAYPRWLVEDAFGLPPSEREVEWREGRVMLRFDGAVFVDAARAGL